MLLCEQNVGINGITRKESVIWVAEKVVEQIDMVTIFVRLGMHLWLKKEEGQQESKLVRGLPR